MTGAAVAGNERGIERVIESGYARDVDCLAVEERLSARNLRALVLPVLIMIIMRPPVEKIEDRGCESRMRGIPTQRVIDPHKKVLAGQRHWTACRPPGMKRSGAPDVCLSGDQVHFEIDDLVFLLCSERLCSLGVTAGRVE